jgi:hypothetical protein
MHDKFKMRSRYDLDLGFTENGSEILGKSSLKPLCIFVDSSLVNDPRSMCNTGNWPLRFMSLMAEIQHFYNSPRDF